MKKKTGILESFARIQSAAMRSRSVDRCLVAPSPDLQKRIQGELKRARRNASPALARLLKVREKNRVGFNDGLIFPGSYFPIGTPAARVRGVAGDRAPLRGTIRVVVILVDFSDEGFTAAHDQAYYEDLFFSEGVLPNGSVREYFTDVTGGLVEITGEVVGPYRMPHTLTYYANGDSGTGSASPNARDLAEDAADAANADVDFGLYDNDGDGFVDAFIVLQAGPGAESTGNGDHIWSHKWVLPSVYNADGTQIYAYLVVPEEARIGVCCHELGHLLFGFPDLYDTDYSGNGIGSWCLMSGGSWNGGGNVPAHPSAWCKANQEWVSVVNQTSNSTESIEDVKTSRVVYRLWKDGAASDEYFLVENRQKAGYDQFLPGGGLLIWHVDDAVSSNADETHPKVALEQADDQMDLENGNNRGDGGDPYPGSTNNTSFNDSSSPGSRSYGDMKTCVAVEDISAPADVMTAQLKVKCLVLKSTREKSLFKEFKKEMTKDIFKEIIKERLKEVSKEVKEKEFKEDKEFKEKERKEWKEDKEWKEFEGAGDAGWTGYPRPGSSTPFIHAGLRPDLRRSALAGEDDVAMVRREMMERAARAGAGRKTASKKATAKKAARKKAARKKVAKRKAGARKKAKKSRKARGKARKRR